MPDEKNRFGTESWPTKESVTAGRRDVKLWETVPGDTGIWLIIGAEDPDDGVAVGVEPRHAREIAASLAQRADLIDPPSRRKLGDVPNTPTGIIGEELRVLALLQKHIFETFRDPDGHHRISRLTDGFAIVALMAELDQVAPDRAAKVAEQLADCWIDGASVHEFIVQWSEDYAAGRPVGFNPPPVLPLDITRTTP